MRERKDDTTSSLPVYHSHPPVWLPKIHGDADLGYPGFYPPRPGQDEDLLSSTNVASGFILGHPVKAETFSAQAMINESLQSTDALSKLEELMSEVFVRKADNIPSIPSSTFRMPTRVTFNDAKRQAWFADLANPDVPLHKLGKSVPHGAKGHDLLDLLQSNNVAIPRAVWFLRVYGANETAGLRNKPTYNPTQYSVEWANVVTGYMKKLLLEIALPSAPRPGLNIKQTFKGVLADGDTRDRWISRFTYCLKLLRSFYVEGLVDHRTFLVWLVQQMGSCNLAQAGFITRLTEEYLDDILAKRALARPLVDAFLAKHAEICASSAQEHLVDTEMLLKVLLQRSCLALPDAFISPRMWTLYSTLLEKVMSENSMDHRSDRYIEHSMHEIQRQLLTNFGDIRRRNEEMLFHHLPSHDTATFSTAVSDVKLLNSISSCTDLNEVSFLPKDHSSPAFREKLNMLLIWSVTPLQYGDHRPFAAVTLIRLWRDKACESATRREFNTPSDYLQDQLFDWLDDSDVAGEPNNIRPVALLYEKLLKHDLFSHSRYIQRLIARGEVGLSYTEEVESRHRKFLSWIPISDSASPLHRQRRVILYGARARETPEDAIEREIRKEIRAILPALFGGDADIPPNSTTALLDRCKTLISASRFEQVRTFRHWLLPILHKHIASQRPESDHLAFFKTCCLSLELMAHVKYFRAVLDVTLSMLEHSTRVEILIGATDILHRYAIIWTCMDVKCTIVAALEAAHHVWKTRGIQSRPLFDLLIEFDQGQYLSESSRERIMADINSFTQALQPVSNRTEPVPDVLPEILLLAGDPMVEAPSILANSLWIKYRTTYDWAWKVWDNTVASLRQVPIMTCDIADRRACALRYGTFLWHVDQHLPHGLDSFVLQWFYGPGKSEVAALSADAWDILSVVLLYLTIHDALKTTTIMKGLVYPAWHSAASSPADQDVRVPETHLRAANKLCSLLLLQEDGGGDDVPPRDLFDIQSLRTRRQAVYQEPHFSLLVAAIPLLISLEGKEDLPLDIRDETRSLRQQLCQDREFCQGVYRNLDVVREAFENSPQLMENTSETLTKRTMAGLRMILYDSADDLESQDWPEVTGLLSPWKIAATTIQMQFIIRQLGRALIHESTHDIASADLDKLTFMLLHYSKTSEEAFYVAEMARGADSIVAGKFINNGLKCITEALNESTPKNSKLLNNCLKRVGELLRVLVYAAQPFRGDSSLLPAIESSIQDSFLDMLLNKLSLVESSVKATASLGEGSPHDSLQELTLLARLLQFILGFRMAWSQKMKDLVVKISESLFNLILIFATGDKLNLPMFALLLDTLVYVYDEIPPETKSVTCDLFRYYPNISVANIPYDLPQQYQKQLLSLLPHLPENSSVSNLIASHRDQLGNITYGPAIVNRPWEWIENLGEPPTSDPKDEEKEEKDWLGVRYTVKNSGSLSLDSFGARLTGDGIIRNLAKDYDSRMEGNVWTFEDGLSADGIFTRDWRETRVDLSSEVSPTTKIRVEGDQEQDTGLHSGYAIAIKAERRHNSRASPASSIVSRSSARGSITSLRPSPGALSRASTSTIGEIIDVDNFGSGPATVKETASKRKAPAVSDDEIEIIEGPTVAQAGPSTKKQRTKTVAKSKARKK